MSAPFAALVALTLGNRPEVMCTSCATFRSRDVAGAPCPACGDPPTQQYRREPDLALYTMPTPMRPPAISWTDASWTGPQLGRVPRVISSLPSTTPANDFEPDEAPTWLRP